MNFLKVKLKEELKKKKYSSQNDKMRYEPRANFSDNGTIP